MSDIVKADRTHVYDLETLARIAGAAGGGQIGLFLLRGSLLRVVAGTVLGGLGGYLAMSFLVDAVKARLRAVGGSKGDA
jgi:hypothetical protein